jgi:hypothetical protein
MGLNKESGSTILYSEIYEVPQKKTAEAKPAPTPPEK